MAKKIEDSCSQAELVQIAAFSFLTFWQCVAFSRPC